MNMVYIMIAAEERRPFRIDHPGDLRVGVGLADCGDGRQGVNDIAERARLDDED